MVWLLDVMSSSSILYSFFSYLTLNNIVTLKSGLEDTQGHSNWYQYVRCLMIDFTKAFDCVDHVLLLTKIAKLATRLHCQLDLFIFNG